MISYFRKPNFVFFGTPEFAATVLRITGDAGFPPMALVANPDRPVGRKKIITSPPTKRLVIERRWPTVIFQPERPTEITAALRAMNPDFFVVAAYAKILPREIIEIPLRGVIGVHPSLLPLHRGATPIQSVILVGDKKTGVALFLIDEKVDHGPLIASRSLHIAGDDTYVSLHEKLAELGGAMLAETMPLFARGEITPVPQDETKATYTRKFIPEDGLIPFDVLAQAQREGSGALEIERKIRALNPEPGVYTVLPEGKRMKILEASVENKKLRITKIQKEGETPRMRYVSD